MQIHNFLCDLLASTKLLIDNHLFPHQPGLIKSYEFNLGNRAFQLGPEPTSAYALPAAIVSINDETINFGGRRSDLIQQNKIDNINKIPVLYNETNEVAVYVHEEQSVVLFSIAINCESQLQAKEIAYQIKKTLPLFKNINMFEFTTYLEINSSILFDILDYNITTDEVDNLYTKFNHNTGDIEYCFALTYNPLIRLDSVNTSISDSSQSTFACQMEVAYVIQFPQYLLIESENTIESINFSFDVGRWPIVTDPIVRTTTGIESSQKIDRTLIIETEDTSYPSGVIISKTETEVYISIQYTTTDFMMNDDLYSYRFYRFYKKNIYKTDLTPTYVYPDENKIVFVIPLDDYNESYTPSTTNPLYVDFYYNK